MNGLAGAIVARPLDTLPPGQRQCEDEGGFLSGCAFDRDGAAVTVNDTGGDIQPEAHAGIGSGLRVADAEETFEDPALPFGGNAYSVVVDTDLDFPGRQAAGDEDIAAGG